MNDLGSGASSGRASIASRIVPADCGLGRSMMIPAALRPKSKVRLRNRSLHSGIVPFL
jgi:hypothetical protein